ncbi:MAG: VWA domain-containing protein [Candidatus Acidiferrales bacterium]
MTLIIRSLKPKGIRNWCLATAGLLFCGLAGFAQSQSSPPAPTSTSVPSGISVETELVVLPVSVTDAKGDVVLGLGQQDFRVYDDGRLQKVTMFQQRDTPVTVGLIVDHSRSMGAELPEVAAAVSSFAQSSNPSDEMFVVDFNDDVSVELMDGKPFSNDPKELAKAVSAVRARGRTALYDAVAEGVLHLQLGHSDRKALIIVSDGGDNASQQKFSQVLALAQRSHVLIYCIGLIGETGETDPGVLRRFSKATGGIAYFPDKTNTVTKISTQIARDLREQYTLGFTPEKSNAGTGFRKIEVKVTASGHGKIHVRTRSGYFAGEEKPSSAQLAKGAK